jgi:hypothetical protein
VTKIGKYFVNKEPGPTPVRKIDPSTYKDSSRPLSEAEMKRFKAAALLRNNNAKQELRGRLYVLYEIASSRPLDPEECDFVINALGGK